MISFSDFAPRQLKAAGFLKTAEYESFEESVDAADQWIAKNAIDLINIETVVLPNVWSPREDGTTADGSLSTTGNIHTTWHQFVRVWYRE